MANEPDDQQRRRVLGILGAMGAMAGASLLDAPSATAAPPGRQRRIGVALGSGGLHGTAHVGVIRTFEASGFRPDIITGTSVGAIAGVL